MAGRRVITIGVLALGVALWVAAVAGSAQAQTARPCNTCPAVPVPTSVPPPTATVPSNR